MNVKKLKTMILLPAFILVLTASCGKAESVPEPAGSEPVHSEEIPDTIKEDEDMSTPDMAASDISIDETKEPDVPENETPDRDAAVLLYQGHASVRISTPEGKIIYVDPFMGTGYDAPADLILITHGHYDHTQTNLIETRNAGCEEITWEEALRDGKHQTFDLGYVMVEAVEAGYNKNHDVSECVGYILTFSNGSTLYLSGDTSTTPQMSELADRKLDYAFFCCDGVYNMDVPEAMECALAVGAKHSIPYHMIPANNSEGFDRDVAESFDVPGRIVLKPGEELVLE